MERSPVQLAAFSVHDITVILPDGAANIPVSDVSGAFFTVLSMAPSAGRLIGPSDVPRAAPKVVVISERLARTAYGGVENAVGKTVGLESQTYEIVGVVAGAFAFPNPQVDVWRPGWQYERFPEPGSRQTFGFRTTVVGLLNDGATLDDVRRAGGTVAQRLAIAAESATPSEFVVRRLLDDMVAPIKPALVTLAAGMALVLIAAYVNLATLLLARHTSRQRELAVRVALGAGRWRVARPVLLELLMLSAGGGLAGGLLGWWLLNLLPLLAPRNLPRIESVQFDAQSLVFAATVALATALAVGVLPALRMPSADVRELTSASGRIRVGSVHRVRRPAAQRPGRRTGRARGDAARGSAADRTQPRSAAERATRVQARRRAHVSVGAAVRCQPAGGTAHALLHRADRTIAQPPGRRRRRRGSRTAAPSDLDPHVDQRARPARASRTAQSRGHGRFPGDLARLPSRDRQPDRQGSRLHERGHRDHDQSNPDRRVARTEVLSLPGMPWVRSCPDRAPNASPSSESSKRHDSDRPGKIRRR